MKKLNTSFKISKTFLLIPLFFMSFNSCRKIVYKTESGIVKAKIDNKVYLTPVNDTNNVYRVINFNRAPSDHITKNLYLNMNKGDVVVWYAQDVEIIPSKNDPYRGTHYYIQSINGKGLGNLPDLVEKNSQDEKIRKIQQEYNSLKQK